MSTDWKLIREMMAAVIDSCETIEAAGYTESERQLTVDVAGQDISLYEFMVSAWTLSEHLRYRIVRDRHDQGIDQPYVPEAARAIVGMAQACAELIGAGEARPAEADVRAAIDWYRAHAVPHVQQAIARARAAG